MMKVIKNIAKRKIKREIAKITFFLIKPFIIPIILILTLVLLVTSITDILYIAFDNDEKIDMKNELAYYDTTYDKTKDKEEIKGFFTSVFDFVNNIFGTEMSEETDWPVERIL